jgi:hypothetical protein
MFKNTILLHPNFLTKFVAILVFGHCSLIYAQASKVDELLSETRQVAAPKTVDFQQLLREKGSNLDVGRAVADVQALISDLERSLRGKNRGGSGVFECRPLQGDHALFVAAQFLVKLSLTDDSVDPSSSSRRITSDVDYKSLFQSSFREFQKSCKPEDVAKGKKFLDELSTTLEGLREQRKVELARRQAAKEENDRLKADETKALIASRTAQIAKEKQAQAESNHEAELFRQERQALLKSGKTKPVTASEAAFLLDAIDGTRIIFYPPYKPDQRMYKVTARLDRWINSTLIFKAGPNNEFWVLPTDATIYIGDTKERLSVGSYVHVVGRLISVTPASPNMLPLFEASYISIR